MLSSRLRSWSAPVAVLVCSTAVSSEPPAKSSEGASERPPFRAYQGPPVEPRTIRRDAVPDALLKDVLADASRRSGVPASGIEIVSTEKITWNDGALGCQRHDGMVTQALVPGYRIWLRGAGRLLDYHASERGAFVLCPAVRAPLLERSSQ